MNYKIIIYLLLNYIISISTLLYSIIKRTNFMSFFKNITLFLIAFNAVGFFVFQIYKIVKPEQEKFEMDIDLTEQEARDLIKDISDEDEVLDEVKDEETDKEMNQENNQEDENFR